MGQGTDDGPSEMVDARQWRTNVDDRLSGLEAKVDTMSTRIGTVSKLVGPLVPIGIVAALGFIVTAYVAFARMDDARAELHQHEQTDITQAHPGSAEALTKIREEQARQRQEVEQFLQEQRRRDDQNDARQQRIEQRLENLRRH